MELDKLLRSQQTESITKRQQLEKRLSEREGQWAGLKEQTARLTERLAALQTVHQIVRTVCTHT